VQQPEMHVLFITISIFTKKSKKGNTWKY